MRTSTFSARDVEAATILTALDAAGYELDGPSTVTRTVLDTFDGRLDRAGLRLELREDGTSALLLHGRDTSPASLEVRGAPRLPGDLPAGPFRDRVAAVVGVRALLPRVSVGSVRTLARRRDRSGKELVTVALHDGLHLDSVQPVDPTWAVEVVGLEGYGDAEERAGSLLASLGLDRRPGGVLELAAVAAGADLRGYDGAPTVRLQRKEPALPGFRRVLARLADAMDANWQGVVEDLDPEFLHDLRIAVRRTRAVLTQAKRVVPDDVRSAFRHDFRWLGAITSEPRDLDVYVIEWPRYTSLLAPEAAGALDLVLAEIVKRRADSHDVLTAELQSDRYLEVMAGWRSWLAADGLSGPDGDGQLSDVIGRRLSAAQRAVLRRGRAITPASPATALHDLRKDAKQLRYLLECFGSLLGDKPRKAFVRRLKELQDNLGEHQDTEIHVAQLHALFQQLRTSRRVPSETLLAMGRLTEHLDRQRLGARAAFASRFETYDQKRTHDSFDALVRSVARR